MNIFDWIRTEFRPRSCASPEFMYDDMDSQSGYCLPVIYRPFDARDRGHWRDRGSCFDFLYATDAAGKNILDFGPGDGWPSLILAPYARQVVGIDASRRRVAVCEENAERLGISNVSFMHVEPEKPLPFDDGTFDGIVAASSIEQTPDPYRALQELYRVLKKDGRFRIDYEGLNRYRGGEEQIVFFDDSGGDRSSMTLYDRDLEHETAAMFTLTVAVPVASLKRHFSGTSRTPAFPDITCEKLRSIADKVSDVRTCTLVHPSCRTLLGWLDTIGFRTIHATHSGAWFAGQLFDALMPSSRPNDMPGVDELLRPLVQIMVRMPAPVKEDPMVTAVK